MVEFKIVPSLSDEIRIAVKDTIIKPNPLQMTKLRAAKGFPSHNGVMTYGIQRLTAGQYVVLCEEKLLNHVRNQVREGEEPSYVNVGETAFFQSRYIEVWPFTSRHYNNPIGEIIVGLNSGLPYVHMITYDHERYIIDRSNLFFFLLTTVSNRNLQVFRRFSTVNYQAWQVLLWYGDPEIHRLLDGKAELPCSAVYSPEDYVNYALDPF